MMGLKFQLLLSTHGFEIYSTVHTVHQGSQ